MKNALIWILSFATLVLPGCSKEDEWLDEKLDKGDVVPKTIADFQALMDNAFLMNLGAMAMGMIASDNYYITGTDLNTLQQFEINSYRWDKVIFTENTSFDWSAAYSKVFVANVVLDGLETVEPSASEVEAFSTARGAALFYRAFQFYDLVQTFAMPYGADADNYLGIPLRSTSNINVKSVRATLKETYDKIISDLTQSEGLLPAATVTKYRPTKAAAQALLARVYQAMGDYANAKTYADKALMVANGLIDFNTLDLSANSTFPDVRGNNPEIIFHYSMNNHGINAPNSIGRIDSNLYVSYLPDDLRRSAFYTAPSPVDGKIVFKGSYAGPRSQFSGLAVNELYLIKAECEARDNQLPEAMSTIRILLEKRFVTDAYVAPALSSQDEVLNYILSERRKELPFTGQLRWEDLRRLNQEPSHAITLTRDIEGVIYQLPPNDLRYAYPIPEQEIDIYGLQQNVRE